jgi:hypothetical protein
MNQSSDDPRTHFHIYWYGKKHMDWECFITYDDATVRALQLAQPGEVFRIDEISVKCPLRRTNVASAPA